MDRDCYIFGDAAEAPELVRLRLLESVFDAKTQAALLSVGELAGRRCLEVGAGAGSIAKWMADRVGAGGRVIAVDPDVRFLRALEPEVEVLEGQLGAGSVPAASFALAHARYVLVHNADARGVLAEMLRALEPGGALVLEEPDFSAAVAVCAPPDLKQAFESVQRALSATFSSRGLEHAFGRRLADVVRELGAELVSVDYDAPAARGGSELAQMMRLSTLALEEKYVATGAATPADIANYAALAAEPECWAVYYATVRVVARKPAS